MINPQAQSHSPLTADQAAATLGTATNLQNQLLEMHHPQESTQEAPQTTQNSAQNSPESAPQQEQPQETAKEPLKEEKDPMKEMELMFTQKLDEIRQELKKDNQREIDTLKQTITSALAEEDTNEPSKTA